MKKCAYCGRENDNDATHCRECGAGEFLAPGPAPTQPRVEAGKDESEATTPAEDSIPELSAAGESVICTTCHTLNVPDVTFCRRCGAPIGFISTIVSGLVSLAVSILFLRSLGRESRSDESVAAQIEPTLKQ